MANSTLKRQNFNVTPEEEAQLQSLREVLAAPSIKDALLRATRILLTLTQEVREGKRIYSVDRNGRETRLLVPDIEAVELLEQKWRQAITESTPRYPATLMQEYHALTDEKLRRTLTAAEAVRLQEIRNEIADIDRQRPKPDTWDIQAQKLRAELAQLRAEVDALPDAQPTSR